MYLYYHEADFFYVDIFSTKNEGMERKSKSNERSLNWLDEKYTILLNKALTSFLWVSECFYFLFFIFCYTFLYALINKLTPKW